MARREWNPDIDLLNVTATDDYHLRIEFTDGTKAVYDAGHLVDKGVFKKFEDIDFFKRAHIAFGTVVWDEMLDMAPEALYEDSILSVG